MWVENKIEGDRSARMKLDKGPLTARKIGLKAFKHAIWLVISLWTGFTLVAYFTPSMNCWRRYPSVSPVGAVLDLLLRRLLLHAGRLPARAGLQVHVSLCPIPGVMFDPDTLVITYDPERGEPRGARKKVPIPRPWAIVWTADSVLRFVQPASISARVSSTNALDVARVLTLAIRSWTRSASHAD
jgi:polyferredoxin